MTRDHAIAAALRALADAFDLPVDPEPQALETAPQSPPDALLDRRAIAKRLGVSVAQVDRLCRRESDPLPAVRVGDVRRFRLAEVDAWVDRQRVTIGTGRSPRNRFPSRRNGATLYRERPPSDGNRPRA